MPFKIYKEEPRSPYFTPRLIAFSIILFMVGLMIFCSKEVSRANKEKANKDLSTLPTPPIVTSHNHHNHHQGKPATPALPPTATEQPPIPRDFLKRIYKKAQADMKKNMKADFGEMETRPLKEKNKYAYTIHQG